MYCYLVLMVCLTCALRMGVCVCVCFMALMRVLLHRKIISYIVSFTLLPLLLALFFPIFASFHE